MILPNTNVAAGCGKIWICCKHWRKLQKTWEIPNILFHCKSILSETEKTACCKKIRFAASCSNPSGGSSNLFFGRGIRLSRGMLHVKFYPNPSNNFWDIAICNKISSKMLHFAATKWSVHAPKFPKWERRSKYTIMPSFIFSARSEAYLFFWEIGLPANVRFPTW